MRLVDVFCGAGGFSCGAIAAGAEVVLGIDHDEVALKCFAANCTAARAVCADALTVEFPDAAPDLHVHFSPPCTALSKARAGGASAKERAQGLATVRWSVELALDKGYVSWSVENVSSPGLKAMLADLVRRHPTRVAFVVLNAADYGVPSDRVRIVVSTPAVCRALKELPVHRVSVAEAFANAGLALPMSTDMCYVKSNTIGRDGGPCVRSVAVPSFCVTASHPSPRLSTCCSAMLLVTPFEHAGDAVKGNRGSVLVQEVE